MIPPQVTIPRRYQSAFTCPFIHNSSHQSDSYCLISRVSINTLAPVNTSDPLSRVRRPKSQKLLKNNMQVFNIGFSMGCDAYVDRMSSNRPDSPVDDPIEDSGILRFQFRTSRTSEKNIIFYAHVTAVVMRNA